MTESYIQVTVSELNEYVDAFFEMMGEYGDVLVDLAYKYEYESEDKRVREKLIALFDLDVGHIWENDWCEGQSDLRLYGISFISDMMVENNADKISEYVGIKE